MAKTKIPVVFAILFTLCSISAFSFWAFFDNERGALSLNALTPILSYLIKAGSVYFANAPQLIELISGLIIGLLVLGTVFNRKSALIYLALVSGVASQAALLLDFTQEGSWGYLLTFGLALMAVQKSRRTTPFFEGSIEQSPFSWRECFGLCSIILVALVYRYYALNRVVDFMEGELTPYAAGSTSFGGMPVANKGINGPWAPLGLLYYPPIYIASHFFGTTILSIRMSSAMVGVATVPILYLFLRQIGGTLCAPIGALLFAFDSLHIGWSRTDIHPHGVTTWPTLLLCWSLVKALEEKKTSYYFLTALLMGLTWHQYPSGQSAVSIPIFTLGLYALTHGFRLPCKKRRLGWILLGVVLWVIGLPLSYFLADGQFIFLNPFTLTTQRTSWGNTSQDMGFLGSVLYVVSIAWQHSIDVVQSIAIKVPYLFHQDFLPEVPGIGMRVIPFLTVPLIVLGVAFLILNTSKIESLILISWMVAGVLPAILSEHAYAKRMSTLFPALDCLTALVLTWLVLDLEKKYKFYGRKISLGILSGAFLSLSCFSASAWFSGRQFPYGEPPEAAVAQQLASFVQPNTIIIEDLWKDYDEGKYLYLLMDKLSGTASRPNVVYFTRPDSDPIFPYIEDARLVIPKLKSDPSRWWYTWTRLEFQFRESVSNEEWRHVLYFLQDRSEPEGYTARALSAIDAKCRNKVVIRFEQNRSVSNKLIAIRCDL